MKTREGKDGSTGKIIIAVVLLFMALSIGTYAFVDMSQHKLDNASGEGQGYQVTLHNVFDPTSSAAVDWNVATDPDGDDQLTAGELPKEIYVASHEDSSDTFVRVRLMEFLGFGGDFPYTEKRFVTGSSGKFLSVPATDANTDATGVVTAFEAKYGDIDLLIGHNFTVDDVFWFRTKLDQCDTGTTYNTTTAGAWFIKSGRIADFTASNGQLGAYLQYRAYASISDTGEPVPAENGSYLDGGVLPNEHEAGQTASETPFVTGAVEMKVSDDDITVGSDETGRDQWGQYDDMDPTTATPSTADTVALDHKYIPVDFTAFAGPVTGANPGVVSSDFRQFVRLNYGDDVMLLSDWISDEKPGDKWVIDDTDEYGANGWIYWVGGFNGALNPDILTPNLLDSIQLVKQPTKSFAYSQYVTMQAVDAEQLSELDNTPQAIFDVWTTPVVP